MKALGVFNVAVWALNLKLRLAQRMNQEIMHLLILVCVFVFSVSVPFALSYGFRLLAPQTSSRSPGEPFCSGIKKLRKHVLQLLHYSCYGIRRNSK